MKHVAVIGAGWAGLAAAHALARRKVRVTVYEASRQLGGRARRVSLDGQHLDNGQHILIGAYRHTLEVMRQIGVEAEAAFSRMPLELRYADGFRLAAPRLPAPLHLGLALACARGLNWGERLSAVRFMAALRKQRFLVEPDISVAALLESHGQRENVRRHLWDPLCVSALNTPPGRASAAAFCAVLRDSLAGQRADSDLLIPRVDLGALFADPAARDIERHGGQIRLGSPVRRIEALPVGFKLDVSADAHSDVILATGPQHAAALLEDIRFADVCASIDALHYQPIATCYLQYDERTQLPTPMLGFTGQWVQWLFDRGQLGGPRGLLAAVISAEGAHRELDQAELTRRVHEEIAAALPAAARAFPAWSRIITEKRATFSCDAGIKRPSRETAVRGLQLAGDYVASDYPGTLETAVRSGLAAAAGIAAA